MFSAFAGRKGHRTKCLSFRLFLFYIPLLDPKVRGEDDIRCKARFPRAVARQTRTKIIVPTPALCEVLIGASEAAPQYLDIINRSSRFKVCSLRHTGSG